MALHHATERQINEYVNQAFNAAPTEETEALSIAEDNISVFESFAELGDGAILYDAYSPDIQEAPLAEAPNQVIVETSAELAFAVDCLERILKKPVNRDEILEDIEHERQHLFIAERLGFETLRYGMAINLQTKEAVDLEIFSVFERPARPISKLALAVAIVAPFEPSRSDMSNLRSLGYEDPQDVIRRVESHNRKPNQQPLPLPLSAHKVITSSKFPVNLDLLI